MAALPTSSPCKLQSSPCKTEQPAEISRVIGKLQSSSSDLKTKLDVLNQRLGGVLNSEKEDAEDTEPSYIMNTEVGVLLDNINDDIVYSINRVISILHRLEL